MQYRSVKGFSGAAQVGILLAFFGVGLVLAGLVQLGIGMMLLPPGVPLSKTGDEILKVIMKPENVGYARLTQVLGSFLMLCFPALIYLLICHGKNTFWLGFNRRVNAGQLVVGFLLIFCTGFIAGPLDELTRNLVARFPDLHAFAQRLEDSYSEQVEVLSNLKSWGEFAMALLVMAFFPAMFEEIFFRGAIQNILERWWKAPLIAIIVTSLLFSFIHMSVYLFVSRTILGFALGLMYQRSKNIWVNIVAHFLNNAIALTQLFLVTRHGEKIEADKLSPAVTGWIGLAGVVITVSLFFLFEKISARNRFMLAFDEQNLMEKDNPIHSIAQQ
jgi:membrane protease YdiL (CAAX protease family)